MDENAVISITLTRSRNNETSVQKVKNTMLKHFNITVDYFEENKIGYWNFTGTIENLHKAGFIS